MFNQRARLTKERMRLQERLRRLQELYVDGYPEQDYRREREALPAALHSVRDVIDDEVLSRGDNIEGPH
jgi:hypothetical protein